MSGSGWEISRGKIWHCKPVRNVGPRHENPVGASRISSGLPRRQREDVGSPSKQRASRMQSSGHGLARALIDDYIRAMCGRIIQSSGPLHYAIVDGINVRRVHNYPPRWNVAPSQELLVIRRNHQTGEVSLDPLRWGLIPYWCNDPKGGRKPINAK